MSLLYLIIAIVVVGIVLYAVNRFVPMEPRVKTILNWVVIGVLVLWLLKALGIWAALAKMTV